MGAPRGASVFGVARLAARARAAASNGLRVELGGSNRRACGANDDGRKLSRRRGQASRERAGLLLGASK